MADQIGEPGDLLADEGVWVVIAGTSECHCRLSAWHFRKKPDSYFLSLYLKELHSI